MKKNIKVGLLVACSVALVGLAAAYTDYKRGAEERWASFTSMRAETVRVCESAMLEPLRLAAVVSSWDAPAGKTATFTSVMEYTATPPDVYLESAQWEKSQFSSSAAESDAMLELVNTLRNDCHQFGQEVRVAFMEAARAAGAPRAGVAGTFRDELAKTIQSHPGQFPQSFRFWKSVVLEADATAVQG